MNILFSLKSKKIPTRLITTARLTMVLLCWAFASIIALHTIVVASTSGIAPPTQPDSGPGGSQYAHALVAEHNYGEGDLQYWLFEPADPKPKSAAVVIFNHGWGAMTPGGYRAWINHIVRRGNIVIYSRYQASLRTKPEAMRANAVAATKDALERLNTEAGHVRPKLDKLAVVGHSAGGQISAGMAANATSSGLPPFKAVMCVEPGKTWGPRKAQIPLDDVSAMPASTLLLTVVGDRDTIVKDIDAKRIINETVRVPSKNKNLVTIVSDSHGSPALIANHFCPAAPAADTSDDFSSNRASGSEKVGHGVNALDYYCTWKLFDALEDAAFYGKNREYALGNTKKQRYMGVWSDGVPVKELVVQIGAAK